MVSFAWSSVTVAALIWSAPPGAAALVDDGVGAADGGIVVDSGTALGAGGTVSTGGEAGGMTVTGSTAAVATGAAEAAGPEPASSPTIVTLAPLSSRSGSLVVDASPSGLSEMMRKPPTTI